MTKRSLIAFLIFGSVFGIILGLFFNSIYATIVGFGIVLFAVYEKKESDNNEKDTFNNDANKEEEDDEEEKLFKYNLLVLLAEVMKADGKLKSRELDSVKSTIRRYYRSESKQKVALKQFQLILKTRNNIHDVCNFINDQLDDVGVTELFMELLAVAYADDDFNDKEKPVIKQIRNLLGISTQEYQRIYALFMKKRQDGYYRYKKTEQSRKSNGSQNESYDQTTRVITIKEQEAYNILGVSENTSDEEIKKAYRALALMYHPDKVSSLGDEAIRQATESMKQINLAWDVVKEARGMR